VDIGPELPPFIAEPIEDPFRRERPAGPEPAPVEPVPEREKEPAQT
jgi:hypothetical protein